MAKTKDYEVAYICNGRNPKCSGKQGCYYRPTNSIKGPCMHTIDREYAKNGARDPRKNKDLFDRFEANGVTRYYEKY